MDLISLISLTSSSCMALNCPRTYLVAGDHRWIQINGVPTMGMDRVMKPMLMGLLMILHCMHMVHILAMHNTPNR